jgi:hypothetical protein
VSDQAYHLAQLRHLYDHMVNGRINDMRQAADGLLSPAIECFEASNIPLLLTELEQARNECVRLAGELKEARELLEASAEDAVTDSFVRSCHLTVRDGETIFHVDSQGRWFARLDSYRVSPLEDRRDEIAAADARQADIVAWLRTGGPKSGPVTAVGWHGNTGVLALADALESGAWRNQGPTDRHTVPNGGEP